MPFILQIAVFTPITYYLDYLPPIGFDPALLQLGMRLRVPFKKGKKIGLLIAIANETEVPPEKLKNALEILDSAPLLLADSVQLIQWASNYYHYPIGEAIVTMLPASLVHGKSATHRTVAKWQIIPHTLPLEQFPKITPLQLTVLRLLADYPQGLTEEAIKTQIHDVNRILRSLEKKGWIKSTNSISPILPIKTNPSLQLNSAQQKVVTDICQHLEQFYPCLLDGITGSGKTEVYLQIIQQILLQGKQALILVPEINLTPQMLARFQQRFFTSIVVLHSKLTDVQRLQAWLAARDGEARIVIGTRSAVWTPLQNPGIFVVDEEHDTSYKQQDHFRYSARDIALVRAQQAKVPIILGSATPSLDTLYHAHHQRYHHFILPERAGTAVHPTFHIVDMRQQPMSCRLSIQLRTEIEDCLAINQQILLFINRRGYAPTLMCFNCGWVARCQHCEANLTYHDVKQRLICHHCGHSAVLYAQCPHCQHPKLHLLGQGTERIEDELKQYFPQARILRIDSDSTQRKKAMQNMLVQIHENEVDILVGTQMLAKGHHFPNVTLVGVLGIDSGLFGVDFRAGERMAQLLIQVAGRAGRAESPGKVVIQTYHPQHPILLNLIKHGYSAFAQQALSERQQAHFPPFTRLALLRAEAQEMETAMQFLRTAKSQAEQYITTDVRLWGPVQAPMEKRAAWYRAQLLLQAKQRDKLQFFLTQWLPQLKSSTEKLRWSLDVDPQDLL